MNTSHLNTLEAEAIYVLREAAAQFEHLALLFSGGKDSICLVHLCKKAFRPGKFPFPLLHIDTEHNFPETIEFRDRLAANLGERLVTRSVQSTIDAGRAREQTGPGSSRNTLQTTTLLDAAAELKLNALIGGARRDEEKARAKERFFSFRNEFGQWDPKNQRPELWNLFNGKIHPRESMRVFPLSNWTELDVWCYIERELIEVPSVYFSHNRKCYRKRDGSLVAQAPFVTPHPEDKQEELIVRCRTVGDMTCTGLVESPAKSVAEIILEIAASRTSERGLRIDDKTSESAMEDRKRQGYF